MKKLKNSQRLLVAFTLFGMFFGAGNLIFPVHLGQLVGRNALPAMIGFIITAVGIPILAVAAIGNTHSDGLHTLSNRVGKEYGYVFTCLLYLTIGPFFAIPRCASTSFTVGVQPLLKGVLGDRAALLIFSFVFFAFVLFCSLRPGKITLWIGKIINPIFLVFLFILVIVALKGASTAVSSIVPAEGYETGVLLNGFVEGYGTMDAIAGLAFGIVVIDIIRSMGISDDHVVAKEVVASGTITGILMMVIYAATIFIGAQSRGLFEVSENGGIALALIADHYLGYAGLIVLAITIIFACLKTSIGLVTSCADAFSRMFPNALSYKAWAIIFSVFSFVVSNVGLSKIIEYAIPMLMFLYPLTITITLLALFEKMFHRSRAVYVSVTVCTGLASMFDLFKTLPAGLQNALQLEGCVTFAGKYLPLYDMGLGWVLPAVIGLLIGLIISRMSGYHAGIYIQKPNSKQSVGYK